MARRSARLASKTHEVQPPTLDSVSEHDERSNASSLRAAAILESPAPTRHHPSTPTSSAIKPPMSAMHPSKVHTTMAPPSPGLRLGFTDIRPVATKRGHELPSGIAQLTPTKAKAKGSSSSSNAAAGLPSTPFTFSVSRPPVADPSLSSRAKQMMDELRGEAAKIKAELAAQRIREQAEDAEAATGRKVLKPKGKTRFSAAHLAAFEKMDSIENHPSAYRAKITTPVKGITTPVKGIKRSSSRANLDEIPASITRRTAIKRSPSKARLDEVDSPQQARKLPAVSPFVRSRAAALEAQEGDPPTPAKRFKQRLEDDASSTRPSSRDGSSIPRPKSSGNDLAGGGSLSRSKSTMSLVTPVKASLARAAAKGPTITAVANSPSPSKSELTSLKRSATTANLKEGTTSTTTTTTPARRILSPGGFQRVRSILRGQKGNSDKPGSALPLPSATASASKTPALPRVDKALPALPGSVVTTPRRKLIKTPNSPSPSFFRSLSKSKSSRVSNPVEANFPNMDSVMAGSTSKKAKGAEKPETGPVVAYPDLSVFSGLAGKGEKSASMPPPSVPGTFSFRSDHTINFNSASPAGFGASPGQSSVRQVRSSMLPMPGSFPGANASADPGTTGSGATRLDTRSGNKENKSPRLKLPGISHGMSTKKRNRAATDEEDERAAKKRKNDHEQVPEGDALLAPRLLLAGKVSGAGASSSPQKTKPDAAAARAAKAGCKLDAPAKKTLVPRAGVQPLSRTSPQKKAVLSLSRLNMLARPKTRQQ
ncbi:uncharacterized protein DNG_03890 [Cephalotrichum gorgonifer]|uniref:Erythromycin esterase n=1 Tax=Cephalotrichum gorgonifer TaxID=2041049 RepID=A0AAE8MW20_9PEZI|nr:uncharacterized protein DNG_03890 [Cephalotrichum gorgonifer]